MNDFGTERVPQQWSARRDEETFEAPDLVKYFRGSKVVEVMKLLVLHVITGLGNGGAENQLLRLIEESGPKASHIVVHLGGSTELSSSFKRASESVVCFPGRNLWGGLTATYRLSRMIRAQKPDVVQGWLPHGNLLASLASIIAGHRRVFWNIRSSSYSSRRVKLRTRAIVRTLAWLSSFAPRKIISCGPVATRAHIEMGFCESKFMNIPNGYKIPVRRDRKESQEKFRENYLIPTGRVLIGMVARYHELKDHSTLIQALASVRQENQSFQLILAGRGMVWANDKLKEMIEAAGLQDVTTLLGETGTGSEVFEILDLHVLSSRSEGFPNVVAESMLHGVPNIATRAGEAPEIIGDKRWVVDTEAPEMLAESIADFLGLSAADVASTATQQYERVQANYGIDSCVSKYRKAWEEVRVYAFPRYGNLGASSRVRFLQYQDQLRKDGIEVHVSSLLTSEMLADSYLEGWKLNFRLFRAYVGRFSAAISARNHDVWWVQRELFPYIPWFLEKILLRGRTKLVVDFDDAAYLSYEKASSFAKRMFLGTKIESICARADVVTVGSSDLSAAVTRRGARRVDLLYSVPISSPAPKVGLAEVPTGPPKVIGWIGSPASWRAYGHLHLNLMSRHLAELNLELHVYGSGITKPTVGRVKYFPWSIDKESEILATFDIGVMFLEDDEWSRAKCGYKVQQYFAAGLPVLASPVGFNCELIEHGQNGYFVSSSQDFGLYAKEITTNLKLWREMSLNNLDLARSKFDPRFVGSELGSILRSL